MNKYRNSILSMSLRNLVALVIITSILLSGCNVFAQSPSAVTQPTPISPTPLNLAEVVFTVEIPSAISAGQYIYINLLDEVTGLAFNSSRFPMQRKDETHYSIKIPVAVGSILKYRYSREGNPAAVEYTSTGSQVRYRILQINTPTEVTDIIAAWNDKLYDGPTGRITGQILNAADQSPIPDILVTAGGSSTLTSSDGSYILEGLKPGTHNLVAVSLDGAYQPFQQGATVAADSTTPATFSLPPSQLVKVTFEVQAPTENVVGAPIRMAGNLLQLGNTFSDLAGGASTIASRMPVLTTGEDGKYRITLDLPVGMDLRYKYTLGDGFWNAEQTAEGQFQTRQLIIPDHEVTIQDTIVSWRAGDYTPVSFEVQAPADTPTDDSVSIQFSPFGWMEPIPMWSLGNNRWLYVLYSPMNILGSVGYRYCRNDQCGSADDSATAGPSATGPSFTPGKETRNFKDTITSWMWWTPTTAPTTVTAADANPRGATFTAGIELQAAYHPSWQPRLSKSFDQVKNIGSNWVYLTPTWSFTRNNPLILEQVPGTDPLWSDSTSAIQTAQAKGLNVAIFPTPRLPLDVDAWWKTAPRDFAWWNVWFERYEAFLLYHADLASQTNASAIVLGGEEWLSPSLPSGTLPDGSPSGVPSDAEVRWEKIITAVRSHFNGTILWALPSNAIGQSPEFLKDVDGIYLLWDEKLSDTTPPSVDEMTTTLSSQLDEQVKPIRESLNLPIILGLSYPSATGSATACIPSPLEGCIGTRYLARPNASLEGITVNLQEQVDIYNAAFAAINDREWISGVVSRGFYPPVALQDVSSSVHGKPAMDVLWYWFPRLTGAAQ
jgi:hypothetical protein